MTQRRTRNAPTAARTGVNATANLAKRSTGAKPKTGMGVDEFTEFVPANGDAFDSFSEGFVQSERGGQPTALQKRMNSGDF